MCAASAAGLKLTEIIEGEEESSMRVELSDSDLAYVEIHLYEIDDTHNPVLIRKIKSLVLKGVSFSTASGIVDAELVTRIEEIQKKYNLHIDGKIGKDTIRVIKSNFEA